MTRDPLEIADRLEIYPRLSEASFRAQYERGDMRETLAEAAACIREMHEVIGRLPKTADGVPIAPGMMVYVPSLMGDAPDDGECLVTSVINYGACPELAGDPEAQRAFRHAGNDCCREHCDDATDSCKAYSTREAARAARTPEPTP